MMFVLLALSVIFLSHLKPSLGKCCVKIRPKSKEVGAQQGLGLSMPSNTTVLSVLRGVNSVIIRLILEGAQSVRILLTRQLSTLSLSTTSQGIQSMEWLSAWILPQKSRGFH